MDYNNYYEPNGQEPESPKRKGASAVIFVTAIICLVIGALVASLIFPGALSNNKQANATTLPQLGSAITTATTAPTSVSKVQEAAPELQSTTSPYNKSDNLIAGIFKKLEPSVVSVTTSGITTTRGQTTTEEVGAGSGIIISENGYIATNAHVVEGGSSFTVTLSSGEEVSAKLIGKDTITDVAVLKIDRTGLTPATLGDSDNINVGDTAIAIGNALGYGQTVTAGVISASNRKVNLDGQTYEYMQTDAAINPGNSGGALVNSNGEVIGINSAKRTIATTDEYGNTITAEGIGFAIPINNAKPIITKIINDGGIVRPGIGVSVYMIDEAEAKYSNVPKGLVVSSVVENGPAYNAGIRQYDIITALNGQDISDVDSFVKQVQGKNIGEQITLNVYRNSRTYQTTITVADLNAIESATVENSTNNGNIPQLPFGR